MNFQLYLLEGLTRWNEDRGRAIVAGGGGQQQRSYSSRDMDAVNQLSEALYGIRLFDSYTQPREYTGNTHTHTHTHTSSVKYAHVRMHT